MASTQTQTLRGTRVVPGLTVNNLKESQQFFEGLGFAVEDTWEENGHVLGLTVRAGNCRFGLNQDDGSRGLNRAKGMGMSLYIEVDDDIDRVAEMAKAAGITLRSEPADIEVGSRAFSVIEPSGFAITIVSPRRQM